jgi:TetR/AcrR family transcriptional regulator
MATSRRLGLKSSAVRAAIIEAAAEILSDEGFSGLISPKIAQRAGVKVQLVHYYFRTMDDLMIALTRHVGDSGIARLASRLAVDDPLGSLWEMMSDTTVSALEMEFVAAATHRKRMRGEARRYGEQSRKIQAEAIARYFKLEGLEASIPPVAIAFIITAITRLLASETMFGISLGHQEVRAVLEDWRQHLMGNDRRRDQCADSAPKGRSVRKSSRQLIVPRRAAKRKRKPI